MAIIIVDIDGTLLRNGTQPMRHTIDYINEQHKEHRIVVVTGRPSSDRARTEAALRAAGVRYNALRMAPDSANTHELRVEYKRKVGQTLQASGNVILAIDNDADARRAYSSSNIPTKSPGSLPSVKKFWAGSAFNI